jgi:hypothetical protein
MGTIRRKKRKNIYQKDIFIFNIQSSRIGGIYPLEENKQLDYAAFLSLKKSAIIKIDT